MKKINPLLLITLCMLCAVCLTAGAEELDGASPSFIPSSSSLISHVDEPYQAPEYAPDRTASTQGVVAKAKGAGTWIGSYNQIQWTLDTDNGQLTITGSGEVLYAWVMSDQQTSLGGYIRNVTIGEGITSIGEGAFYECVNLQAVSLPQSLRGIGNYAFCNCSSLNGVSLPGDVSVVGEASFANCTALTSISLSCPVGKNAFNGCAKLSTLQLNAGVTSIGMQAFAYCDALEAVAIPAQTALVDFGAFALCKKLATVSTHGEIGEAAFEGCAALSSLTIAPYAGILGRRAFADCSSLETATVPYGITQLGIGAFSGCSTLKSVSLPSSVTALGDYVFNQCTALPAVNLPDRLTEICSYSFFECKAIETISLPAGVKKVSDAAFANCTALTSIGLPTDLTEIGSAAFYGCTSLPAISLGSKCAALGQAAFYGCTALTDIKLPDSLTTLNKGTFYQCAALKKVTFPASLTAIKDRVFVKCSALAQLRLPERLTEIGEFCFSGCKGLTEVALPDGITSISAALFNECSGLESITLPDNLLSIGDHAFFDCSSLSSLSIPSGVTAIGECAFTHCAALKSLSIPNGVKALSSSVLMACDNLETLSFASDVTELGEYALAGCPKLTGGMTLEDVQVIGDYAFLSCSGLQSVSIGKAAASIGKGVFLNCTKLTTINVADDNPAYLSDNGLLYTKDKTGLLAFAEGSSVQDLVLPDSVTALDEELFANSPHLRSVSLPKNLTAVPDRLFSGCSALESVSLPAGLTSIGIGAFYECDKLSTINWPAGLKRIGDSAFSGCSSLEAVYLPSAMEYIGEFAFLDCAKLSTVQWPASLTEMGDAAFAQCAMLPSVSLPEGLKDIPPYAFYKCELMARITLPADVAAIGKYAFAFCRSLDDIDLPTSVTQLGEAAFAGCKALTSITVPQGVASLDNYLFYACDSLTDVALAGDVAAIGTNAFFGTPSLKCIKFEGNAPTAIGEDAFAQSYSELVFEYNQAASRWTTPMWTGPDGIEYSTATFLSGDCGDGVRWSLSTREGELIISGQGRMYDWTAESPAPWADFSNAIIHVTVEEGVTYLGSQAFQNCALLKSAVLPDTATEAGYSVFGDCNMLADITTPYGLRALGDCMFFRCGLLSSIRLSDAVTDIPEYAFYGCCALEELRLPQAVKTVGEGAFAHCTELKKAIFEGKLESVGTGAFYGCGGLTSLYALAGAPSSVGDYAFYELSGQLTVVCDDGDAWLGEEATSSVQPTAALGGSCGTASNWAIDIDTETLTISGSGVMSDYSDRDAPWVKYGALIKRITVTEGITSLGNYSFAGLALAESISLPDSLDSIGAYAMSQCMSLKAIDLPQSLTQIGDGAFAECYALNSVVLPAGIKTIGEHTFALCNHMTEVTLPNGLISIGYSAFYACGRLERLQLPDGLISIGDWAFARCNALTSLRLPSSVAELGAYSFYTDKALSVVELSAGISEIGECAFALTALERLNVPQGVETIGDSAFGGCERLASVVLPSSVKTIATRAFMGCGALGELNLGETQTIGTYAFAQTGLARVALPDNVKAIGAYAFADCANLEAIQAQGSVFQSRDGVLYSGTVLCQYPSGKSGDSFYAPSDVTAIDAGAFYGNRYITYIELGSSVSGLYDAVFSSCPLLTSVTLGEGITELPLAAFGDCAALTQVLFEGAAPSIIGDDAFYGTSEQLVLNYRSGQDGWTEGAWVGPDGVSYSTAIKERALEVTASPVALSEDGTAQAALTLTNNTSAPITISRITPEDSGFELLQNVSGLVLSPGESSNALLVQPKAPIDPNHDHVCGLVVYYNGGETRVSLTFLQATAPYTIKLDSVVATENGASLTIRAVNRTYAGTGMLVNARLLLSVYKGRQLALTKDIPLSLAPRGTYERTVYLQNAGLDESCRFVLYVLARTTLAPMTDPLEQACRLTTQGGVPYSYLGEAVYGALEETPCPPVPEVPVDIDEPTIVDITDVLPVENAAPAMFRDTASTQTKVYTFSTPPAPVSRAIDWAEGNKASTSTITYYVSDIEEFGRKLVNGEDILSASEKDSATGKSDIKLDVDLAIAEKTFGDDFESLWKNTSEIVNTSGTLAYNNELSLANLSMKGKLSADAGSFDKKLGYRPPQVSAGGSLGYSIVEHHAGLEWKILKDWKLTVESDNKLMNAEVSGSLNLSPLDKNVELSAKAGVDVADNVNTLTLSKDGLELVSFDFGAGVGTSASATAQASADKIKFKASVKSGVGGTLGGAIHPVNILIAIAQSDAAKQMLSDTAYHVMLVRLKDDNGNIAPLSCCVFTANLLARTMTSVMTVPLSGPLYFAGNILRAALPRIADAYGIPAPKQAPQQSQGGGTDTTVPGNALTPEQLAAINSAIAGAGVMPNISAMDTLVQQYMQQQIIINIITGKINGMSYTSIFPQVGW